MALRRFGLLFLLLTSACAGSDDTTPPPNPTCATCNEPADPPATCPAGEAPLPSGCIQVGPAACASGFVAHASGFGCVPVVPESACTGATKATLGSTTCTPVGDCNGVFPPPEATVFVDASGSGPPHYATVESAIAAAPTGAVIAVDDGTYDEALGITHRVTLVGRCPARAIVATTSTLPVLNTNAAVTVRGMTLRGGAGVTTTAALTLDSVIVEQGAGRGVLGRAAAITITRSLVRDVGVGSLGYGQALYTEQGGVIEMDESDISGVVGRGGVAFDTGSKIALHRSLIHAISAAPDGSLGGGLTAYQGAELSLVESAIQDTHMTSLALEHAAKGATVQRSTLARVAKEAQSGVGIAIDASEAASVVLEDATLVDIETTGVALTDAGTSVSAQRTAFIDMKPGGPIGFGAAVFVANASTASLDASIVLAASGVALQGQNAAASIALHGSYVGHTAFGSHGDGGAGVAVTHGAAFSADASTVEDCGTVGLFARDEGSTIGFGGSVLRGVRPDANGAFGIGVLLESGASGAVTDAILRDASSVGVFTSAAGGRVARSYLRKNTIGVQAQDGSTIIEISDDAAPLDARQLGIALSVRFEDNGARTGGGELPLPPVPLP